MDEMNVMDVNNIDTEVQEMQDMIDEDLNGDSSGIDWKTVAITAGATLVVEHIVLPKVKILGRKIVSGVLSFFADDSESKDEKKKDEKIVDVPESDLKPDEGTPTGNTEE